MGSTHTLLCFILVIFSAACSVNSRGLPNSNTTQALTYNSTYAHQLRTVPSGPNNPCKFYMLVSRTEDFGGGYMEFVMVTNSCKYCPAYDVVIDCSVAYGKGVKCKVNDGYPLYPLAQWTMHYKGPYGQFPVLSGDYRNCGS